MPSYENMSTDEFQGVLDSCEKISDVTAVMGDLSSYKISTSPIRSATSLADLRSAKTSADHQLEHLRQLTNMCSERMIALAQAHKY